MIPTTVFIREFLGISATFIYRQLLGVKPDFNPSVICLREINRDIFPYPLVHCARGDSETSWEKISGKLKRAITGYYNLPGRAAYHFWKEKLRSEKCRLIHAHFGMEGIMAVPLSEILAIPLVVTLHGFDMSRLLQRRGYKPGLVDMFKKCALVIAISDKFKNDAISLGCPPHKVARHYIGVPVDEFTYRERKTSEGESLNFLQVSNFVEKKGHIYTLKAFAKALERGVRGKLTLIGDGPERPRCEKLSQELGIGDKVEFAGKKPMQEIPGYMDEAHIFIHHSVTAKNGDTEGIPTVIMEAMATGLPILTTIHSGIPELVINNRSGFLVGERDVESYGQKWTEMAVNPGLRASMGQFNRKKVVSEFNMSKQNEILKSLYRRALNEEKI